MDAAKLLIDLYDAVRAWEQADDECGVACTIDDNSYRIAFESRVRARANLRTATDAAAAFADAGERIFAEACKRHVIQAQTSLAVNVPEVQPCYQGSVTCCCCGKLASCYAEYPSGNLCMKCNAGYRSESGFQGVQRGR